MDFLKFIGKLIVGFIVGCIAVVLGLGAVAILTFIMQFIWIAVVIAFLTAVGYMMVFQK